jgi:hypothetical protein
VRCSTIQLSIACLLAGPLLAQEPADPPPVRPAPPVLPAPPASGPVAETKTAKPEDPVVPAPAAAPALSLQSLDFSRPFDLVACESALDRLTQAHPDLVHVKSLGKSRGGHDLWLVTVSDARGGDPERKPALIVGCDVGCGPEPALYAIARLVADADERPEVAALLRERTVYVVPAFDPDLVAAPPSPDASTASSAPSIPGRGASFDRNFPVDWRPWPAFAEREPAPSGPYPLSEPETALLARFLQARATLGTLVELAPRSRSEPARGESAAMQPGGLAPGSLSAFCAHMLGALTLRASPWTGASEETRFGPAPSGFDRTASDLEGRLQALPHFECGTPTVERLRADLWLVDASVRNAGSLPTLGPGLSRSARGPSAWVRASGGRVVAAATRRAGDAEFAAAPTVVRDGTEAWSLGHLQGGEEIVLRLIVQSAEKTALEIALGSLRAGERRVSVALVQPP